MLSLITSFFLNGDIKSMILLTVFLAIIIIKAIKRSQIRKSDPSQTDLIDRNTTYINAVANISLGFGAYFIAVGFFKSFYFISMAGGINPKMLYMGVSNIMIAPLYSTIIFLFAKMSTFYFNFLSKGRLRKVVLKY